MRNSSSRGGWLFGLKQKDEPDPSKPLLRGKLTRADPGAVLRITSSVEPAKTPCLIDERFQVSPMEGLRIPSEDIWPSRRGMRDIVALVERGHAGLVVNPHLAHHHFGVRRGLIEPR